MMGRCVPLCAAGDQAEWWQHETLCPARLRPGEPERCPTCESDNRMVYVTGTPRNPNRERCHDPWHREQKNTNNDQEEST